MGILCFECVGCCVMRVQPGNTLLGVCWMLCDESSAWEYFALSVLDAV